MTDDRLGTLLLPLFVPGDRPERFAAALKSGADAVILDLEDAVAADRKAAARVHVAEAAAERSRGDGPALLVRINAIGTAEHAEDLRLVAGLALDGLMLPKAESAPSVASVSAAAGCGVIALVESAAGLADAPAIAGTAARLAFGSLDYAADIGAAHSHEALLQARSELVLASRLGGGPGPIDGVTLSLRDAAAVLADAAHAAALGFTGKLLIHPAQIRPAAEGLMPLPDEVARAEQILAGGGAGAATVAGMLVDRPVRLRAEATRDRAARIAALIGRVPA